MKTSDIRRRRIQELLVTRFNGNQAALAKAISRAPSQVARWFMDTKNRRNIGDPLARDIEKSLGLPRFHLDTDSETPAATEPLVLYGVAPNEQATVLGLFDKLTATQREDFLKQIAAAVEANEAIVREVGPRLRPPPDDYVGKFLPKVPTKTDIRQQHTGDGGK